MLRNHARASKVTQCPALAPRKDESHLILDECRACIPILCVDYTFVIAIRRIILAISKVKASTQKADLFHSFFRIPGTLQLANINDLSDVVGVVRADVCDD